MPRGRVPEEELAAVQAWFEALSERPARLLVMLSDEECRYGTAVSITVLPGFFTRDGESYCEGEPFTFMSGFLFEQTSKFVSAVMNVHRLYGIPKREAVAFIGVMALLHGDMVRSRRGAETFLPGALRPDGPLHLLPGFEITAPIALFLEPKAGLDEFLEFWMEWGGLNDWGALFFNKQGRPGRPCYWTMPPSWYSPEDLKTLEQGGESAPIPLWVRSTSVEIARSLISLAEASSEAGRSLIVSNSTNRSSPDDGREPRARTRRAAHRPAGKGHGLMMDCWLFCHGLEERYGSAAHAYDAIHRFVQRTPELRGAFPDRDRYSPLRSYGRGQRTRAGRCTWHQHDDGPPSELLSE